MDVARADKGGKYSLTIVLVSILVLTRIDRLYTLYMKEVKLWDGLNENEKFCIAECASHFELWNKGIAMR